MTGDTLDKLNSREVVQALRSVCALAARIAPDEAGDRALFRIKRAREEYQQRRRRASIFGCDDIFGEPAWDILLDLYASTGEGKDISVSSLCIAANVPITTGLRWVTLLTKKGLLERFQDPADGRRSIVRLSAAAKAGMERYLDRVS